MSLKALTAFVLILGAQLVGAQQKTHSQPHTSAKHEISFQEPTTEITNLLKSISGIPDLKDMVEDGSYTFAYEDLKGDNTKEIIVQGGGIFCGTDTGCPVIIIEKHNEKWVQIFSKSIIDDQIAILDKKVNGYACIVGTMLASGIGMDARYTSHEFHFIPTAGQYR